MTASSARPAEDTESAARPARLTRLISRLRWRSSRAPVQTVYGYSLPPARLTIAGFFVISALIAVPLLTAAALFDGLMWLASR